MATREKVLFVDDEPNLLAVYTRLLRRHFDVQSAESGHEALEIMVNSGPFAVIVTDLAMPGMDGIQLLARLCEVAPDTVRILLTGHASVDIAIDAINTGSVFRFLTKPCAHEILVQSIQAGINQYRMIVGQRELHGLKKVKEAMEGIILRFSTIVETRDPYTAGHHRRATELSMAIANALGFDPLKTAGLQTAGMVHDIGNIYVPVEFFKGPDKLSEREFSVIKNHPVAGYDIFKSMDLELPIGQIIHQHHERMDGSGYPKGLAGNEIMMEARIIAVADVVDAMTSDRSYRPGHPIEIALEEIETNAGLLYDPDIAAACLSLFREKGFHWNIQDDATGLVKQPGIDE